MYTYNTTSASQADYKLRRSKNEMEEHIVANFLDTYYYPLWATSTERCTDKDLQIAGLDITAKSDGYSFTIDEKAATTWIGRNLQTFAQEISSVNKAGYTYDGWLLDFDSASDYLLEIWVDEVTTPDNKLHASEDITDATICLIRKKDLWNYLRSRNITSTALKEIGEGLRLSHSTNTQYNGFKITCQQFVQERAANILIPRSTLINTISCYSVRIKDKKAQILRQ